MSKRKLSETEKIEACDNLIPQTEFDNWNALYFACLQMSSVIYQRAEEEIQKVGLDLQHNAKYHHRLLVNALNTCRREVDILHIDYTFKMNGKDATSLWDDGIRLLQLVCLFWDRCGGSVEAIESLKDELYARPSSGMFSNETIRKLERQA